LIKKRTQGNRLTQNLKCLYEKVYDQKIHSFAVRFLFIGFIYYLLGKISSKLIKIENKTNARSFHTQCVLLGDVVGVGVGVAVEVEEVLFVLETVVTGVVEVAGLGKVDPEEVVELVPEGTVEPAVDVADDGLVAVVTPVGDDVLEFVPDGVEGPVVTVELPEVEEVGVEVVDGLDPAVVVAVEDDVPEVSGFGLSSTLGLSVLALFGLSSFFTLFSSSFLLSDDFPCPSGLALSSFGLSSFGLSSGFGLSSLASLAGVSAGLASYFCFGHFRTSAAIVFPSLQLLETNPSQSDTQHSFQILPQTVPLALVQA
jgi:hypothetical protein